MRPLSILPVGAARSYHAGAAGCRRHPFFGKLDWGALLAKTAPPPYVPQQVGHDVGAQAEADGAQGALRALGVGDDVLLVVEGVSALLVPAKAPRSTKTRLALM